MSWFESISALFSGKSQGAARGDKALYIVDAERLVDTREGADRVGPPERVHALQRVARFAERERIKIKAVIGGRALREAAHGTEFHGVQVFYAEQAAGISEQAYKLFEEGRRRGRVVVITSDHALEKRVADQGGATMRVSTLRKALEAGSGDNGQGRPQQQRRQRPPRRDRDFRRPPQQQDGGGGGGGSSGGGGSPKSLSEPGAETTVKNLIDLVE